MRDSQAGTPVTKRDAILLVLAAFLLLPFPVMLGTRALIEGRWWTAIILAALYIPAMVACLAVAYRILEAPWRWR